MDPHRDPGVPAPPPTQHELPYDDGEPMESDRHYEQMHLLTDTLRPWIGTRDDVYVAGNRAVYFSLAQAKNQDFRAPDVIVVLGANEGRRERLSWVAWEEGGLLPNVVIEIVSPSTEREDRGRKKQIFGSVWRLPEYFLYDPFTHRLEGWDLDPVTLSYVEKRPDARGDLPVAQLGLALGMRPLTCYGLPPPSLRWIDANGVALPLDRERLDVARAEAHAARTDAHAARADAEAQRERADAAEREMRTLADEVARLRGGNQ